MSWIPFPDLKGLTFGLKAFVVMHTLALISFVVVTSTNAGVPIEPPWWMIAAYLGSLAAAGVEAVKDFIKRDEPVEEDEVEFEGSVSGDSRPPDYTLGSPNEAKKPTFQVPRSERK